MTYRLDRRTFVMGSLAAAGAVVVPATGAEARTRRRASVRATTSGDERSVSWVDAAGTRSTYHLFMSALGSKRPRGLVVYLDGDGMYGHDHPTSTWALGGSRGVVAQAASRGFATLSVRTPSRDATFWTNGAVNAIYVAALTARIAGRLGVTDVWYVGYSGGSQLITKFLLPVHGGRLTSGGAVIMGGGGAPRSTAKMPVRASIPLLWYTGSLDDGRNTDDDYDALADATRGAVWYRARGASVTQVVPAGLDHEDLGGRFGTVLAGQLDKHR